jgi:hypothetical protein
VLQLTGNGATTAQFQTVIQSAKYNNVSNTPDPTTRDVTTKANDGAADSTVAHTTVTVTPTNDAPVATDETFNATNSAIGNTTLNVNDTNNHGGTADGRPPTPDPTDTSPTTDRPHKEITGDIIANDTDPEAANSDLTATAGTFNTRDATTDATDGGSVTIQADGDFNFEPPPGCPAANSYFDYVVTDNAGTDTGTDTGRVTIASTGCVWYVNNNDAQGNNGTSVKPFDTLAQAQTASNPATPATIGTTFVYDGDDTTTGYDTGYTMDTNETLQSEGATLTIDSNTLHSADAANKASIKNNNADVVTLAGGTTVKGLNIDPQNTGGGIFGTGLGATTVTLDDLNIADNGTKGTQAGLELASSATTTTNVSNLTVNNGDGVSATTTDEGVLLSSAGTVKFADTGTISITTNGAAGLDATSTNLGSASLFDNITVTNSGSGGVSLASTTGSGTVFGDASGTDLSLTTTSGVTPAFKIANSGTVTVVSGGIANLNATGGPAADIVNPTAQSVFQFDDVDSTNSSTDGVNIDGLADGHFLANSQSSITNYAGIGFDLNGGNGTVDFAGAFNNTTTASSKIAEVTGRTAGANSSVTFGGPINHTNGTGAGIDISGNSGGPTSFTNATKDINTGSSDAVKISQPQASTNTVTFSGGNLNIDTTSGNGLEAIGVSSGGPDGTLNVVGSGNTIDTGSGKSLRVDDGNVGAAPLLFDRIAGNGANAGIRLNNTGANNALTVTGVGGTCTAANTSGCSGGTIQNTTGSDDSSTTPVGTAVVLKSTKGVSLTRMHLANNSNYGIRGDSVTGGFGLANSVIDGTSGNENSSSAGSPFNEAAVRFTELTGASNAITSSGISGGAGDNLAVTNSSGTLNRLTLDSNTFGNNSNTQGNHSVGVEGTGSSTVNFTATNNTFTASRSTTMDFIGGGTGGGDVVYQSNHLSNSRPLTPPNGIATAAVGLRVVSVGSGTTTANVESNDVKDSLGHAILLADDTGGGNLTGTVNLNTIGVAATTDSGSHEGDGIQVNHTGGTGTTTVQITNNLVRQYNNMGIQVTMGSSGIASGGNINANITGNTVSNPGTNVNIASIWQGIHLNAGTTPSDSYAVCMNVKGNSIIGSGRNGGTDFRLRQRQNTTVRLPGYGGSATDNAAVESFVANQNDANPNSAGADPPIPSGGIVIDSSGFTGGAACP